MKEQEKAYRYKSEAHLSEEEVRRRRAEDERLLHERASLRAAERAHKKEMEARRKLDAELEVYWS